MEAHAPIKCDQLAIEIVNDLDFRPRFCQEDCQASRERFAIAVMLRNHRQDVFQEPALAAWPADRRLNAQGRIGLSQVASRCASCALSRGGRAGSAASGAASYRPAVSAKWFHRFPRCWLHE